MRWKFILYSIQYIIILLILKIAILSTHYTTVVECGRVIDKRLRSFAIACGDYRAIESIYWLSLISQ